MASAHEALDCLARRRFHILLSDIGMPGMDGYQLIAHVRAAGRELERLPAIAITAYARPEDRQRALLAGYQTHFAKPLEARELVTAVANLCALRGP